MNTFRPVFDSELIFDNGLRKDSHKITVCLSTYKVESLVTRQLDAISSQSSHDFELVISDDCSPDNTVPVVKAYLDNNTLPFPVRFYRSLRNHGIVENRLRGLAYATGEWRMFADGDDVLLPDAVERLAFRLKTLDPMPSLIKVGGEPNLEGSDVYFPPTDPIKGAFVNGSNGFVVSKELYEKFLPVWPIDRIIADDPFFARRALMLKGQWYFKDQYFKASSRVESASGGGVVIRIGS